MTTTQHAPIYLNDTRISSAGVFRCCLATVAMDIKADEPIPLGTLTNCRHCKREFELKDTGAGYKWTPLTP